MCTSELTRLYVEAIKEKIIQYPYKYDLELLFKKNVLSERVSSNLILRQKLSFLSRTNFGPP